MLPNAILCGGIVNERLWNLGNLLFIFKAVEVEGNC
jgi:hypothetical protein